MRSRVVYASNGAKIGDGMRVARVSQDGAKLEILTDPASGRFSEVVLRAEPEPAGPDFSGDFSPDFT